MKNKKLRWQVKTGLFSLFLCASGSSQMYLFSRNIFFSEMQTTEASWKYILFHSGFKVFLGREREREYMQNICTSPSNSLHWISDIPPLPATACYSFLLPFGEKRFYQDSDTSWTSSIRWFNLTEVLRGPWRWNFLFPLNGLSESNTNKQWPKPWVILLNATKSLIGLKAIDLQWLSDY